MSKIVVTDNDGTIHVFESELESFLLCNEWIQENKTEEEYKEWIKNCNQLAKSEKSISLYNDWLVANKINHTMTFPDGQVLANSHTD